MYFRCCWCNRVSECPFLYSFTTIRRSIVLIDLLPIDFILIILNATDTYKVKYCRSIYWHIINCLRPYAWTRDREMKPQQDQRKLDNVIKNLQTSPKGQLIYDHDWHMHPQRMKVRITPTVNHKGSAYCLCVISSPFE